MRATQFVGRQDQLEHIEQHLYHIMTGQPRVVLMQGVAGVGKTRFLEQVWTMAVQLGVQVYAGHGDETLTQLYTPFVDLMPWLEEEQRLTPANPTADRGEAGRLELMISVTRTATTLALHTPILLMVDDLHLADAASLDCFAYLAFALAEHHTAPLLLLGSYRPVPPASRLADLIHRLRHETMTREMELPGIDEGDTRALLRELGVARPTQQLVRTVHEATHGIPLFIEEMIPHLVACGALYTRRGYLATRRGAVDTLQLPPNIAEAIAMRIQTLPQTCLPILSLAACLGERFSTEHLEHIGPASTVAIRKAMDIGISHGMLRREVDQFRFVHTLIRHAFRDLITPAERARLHLRVAQAFERLYADTPEPHVLAIAHHLIEAGALAEADTVMAYARQAGDQAFAMYAWHEAAKYYEAALAATGATPHNADHATARLYYRAALAHHRNQDVGPAQERFEEAAAAYRTLGNIYGQASALMWQTRLHYMHASVPYGVLPPDVPALHDVLYGLGNREPNLRGQILEVLSQSYRHARQAERASNLAHLALALGRQEQDDRLCARAGEALGLASLSRLQVELAITSWQDSLVYGHRTDNLFVQTQALTTLPLALNLKGTLEEAETMASQGADATKVMQDWGEHSKVLSHLASIAVAKGNFQAAEQHAQQTLLMVERSGYPWGGFRAVQALTCVFALRGWHEKAEQILDMILEPGRLFKSPGRFERVLVRVFRQLALVYNTRSLTERTTPLYDELMKVVSHDTYSLAPLCAMIELGEQTLNLTITERPAAILADAVKQGILFTSGWCFAIPRVLGIAARMHGEWEQAAEHFVHAMQVADAAQAWPELARAFLDFVYLDRVMEANSDPELMLELLDRASRIFNELGMGPHARLALASRAAIRTLAEFPEASDEEESDADETSEFDT